MRTMVEGGQVTKAVLIDDLFGRVRAVVWKVPSADAEAIHATINTVLQQACAQYWTGDVWVVGDDAAPEDMLFYEKAWNEGADIIEGRLRLNDRHRNRSSWFLRDKRQGALAEGPPIIVFHSFKGGVGRTTALASYAMSRARRGEVVAVVDFDLDAPGLGRLLGDEGLAEERRDDRHRSQERWGVVDFLLESTEALPLEDYYHVCAREGVTGEGRIEVFPAGSLNDDYLTKLARVDLEVGAELSQHPLLRLLERIRSERRPGVILVDGRAGLSPAAGLLLSGFAHLHVLFATTSPQSLDGLERVVRHLGFEQARRGSVQGECVVVQAMVPDHAEVGSLAQERFSVEVERIFRDGYYASQPDEEDRLWWLGDLGSRMAPHSPVPITYRGKLAFFESIDQVADTLVADPDYAAFRARLDQRLAPAGAGDA